MTTLAASPTRHADPKTLLVETGTGSVEAFGALYDALAPLVHGITVRALPDPAVAERVTERVFLQVWRRAPRYRPDRQEPVPWVLAISYRELAHWCETR